VCNTRDPKRICPKCENVIPYSLGIWGCNLFFAAMGTPKSGKTTFLRILNQQIGDIGRPFGWAQRQFGEQTRMWEQEASTAIMRGSVLQKTAIHNNPAAKEPNLYALQGRGGGVIYAFYDPAGEYMYSTDDLEENAKYLEHLNGFIFLINPLSLPKVREKLGLSPLEKESEYSNIRAALDRIEEACKGSLHAVQKKSVAMCLTRSDVLTDSDLLPPKFREDGGHRGFFNVKDHESTSRIVGDLLVEWLDGSIRERLSVYKNHAFFAFSALGGNPDTNNKLRHAPQPVRVADPFLWLLWKKGFIQGK